MIFEWSRLTRGAPVAARPGLGLSVLRRSSRCSGCATSRPSAGRPSSGCWRASGPPTSAPISSDALAGGAKLAPRISPGKTWSGLVGGMAWAAVGSAAMRLCLRPGETVHAGDRRRGAGGRGAGGRSARIGGQAASRRQGQRASHSRTRRIARSDRRPDGRARRGCRRPAGRGKRVALGMSNWTAPSPENPRRVTILGSTGSVGQSTVDLIARHPASYRVEALVARSSVELLAEQARRLRATLAVVADPEPLPGAEGGIGWHVGRGRGRPGGGHRSGRAAGRMGDGGRRRLRRPRADAGRGATRRHGGARQQGGAGLRRSPADRCDRAVRRRPAAGRFRAQRHFPGLRARPACVRSTG